MQTISCAAVWAAALWAGACSAAPGVAPIGPVEVGEAHEARFGPGHLKGYLKRQELPDSLALLPAPPAEGSQALAADGEAYRALTALRSGPRGALAARDANLAFPQAASIFSCALDVNISEQATPNLNMLLRRTLTDAARATHQAKDAYQRPRPFVVFNAPTCTPADEAHLRQDGAYPSGHSALGWAWALVLTEIAPDHADALLQRGRAFTQSRGVCGVHWKSDIEAGRLVGSAVVARLHGKARFAAQMAAAQDEITQARMHGQRPAAADCTAEAAAMAISARLAP